MYYFELDLTASLVLPSCLASFFRSRWHHQRRSIILCHMHIDSFNHLSLSFSSFNDCSFLEEEEEEEGDLMIPLQNFMNLSVVDDKI